MDLVQTVRKEGSRGGRGEFKWDDVKADQQRENYLGHSLMAPVGRWQKGKDLNWYSRGEGEAGEGGQKSEAEKRKDEIRRVREAEEDAMTAALGLPPKDRNANLAPSGPSKLETSSSILLKQEDGEPQSREGRSGRNGREDRDRHSKSRRENEDRRIHGRHDRSTMDEEARWDRHREVHYGTRSRSARRRRERSRDDRTRYQHRKATSRSPSRDRHRHREVESTRYRSRTPEPRRDRSASPVWKKRRLNDLDSDSQATSPSPPPRPSRGEWQHDGRESRSRSPYSKRKDYTC